MQGLATNKPWDEAVDGIKGNLSDPMHQMYFPFEIDVRKSFDSSIFSITEIKFR